MDKKRFKPQDKGKKAKKTRPAKKGAEPTSIKKKINDAILSLNPTFKRVKVEAVRKIIRKLQNPEKSWKNVEKDKLAEKIQHNEAMLNFIKHTPPTRLGLLSLHYHKTERSELIDSQADIERHAIIIYKSNKNVMSVFDKIIEDLNLADEIGWKEQTKDLFINSPEVKELKIQKNEKWKAKREAKKATASAKEKPNGEAKPKTPKDKVKIEAEEKTTSDAPTEAADDFFITSDGTNYMSNAIVNPNQKDNDDTEQPSTFQKRPQKKNSATSREGNGKPFKAGEKRKWNNKSENDDDDGQPEAKEERIIDTNLHPSWVAKQKQKPTITAFKGSKITFD